MDQGPLVELELADGRRLLNRLVEEGVPVTAACWLKESDDRPWYLYIATPLVPERGGTDKAYGAIIEVHRKMPPLPGIPILGIKAVSAGSPVARAAQELHQRYPGSPIIPYRGSRFGDVSVDGGYVYGPIPAPVR